MEMNVLELFSGIGGMHFALSKSGIHAKVVAAVDINTIANNVYKHNFQNTTVLQKNIQSFTAEYINKLEIEMILMSPPCQPFTRVGLKKDISDNRTSALSHIIDIIPQLNNKLRYILLENVRGFESSEARLLLIKVLQANDFSYQEFIISPLQLNIPNSRERYYLIAKRKPLNFVFEILPKFVTSIPNSFNYNGPVSVREILEMEDEDSEAYESFLIPDKELKRAWIMDVVNKNSNKTCCFTKAYTHYAEGTGSVMSPFDMETINLTFETAKSIDKESTEYIKLLKPLKLRYFTPREILRLMCFPEEFKFPHNVTKKQKYRLLGNSINVTVVANLIKLLCSGDSV